MKLFPPQAEIDLYNEGFGEEDFLQRKKVSKWLSDLLERVDDPVAVALDGEWGSGKTHFLKRWVGAHTLENSGKAKTVYFDAFANDFLDDPLIALTSVISDRFSTTNEKGKFKKVRKFAAKLARPVIRIGLATATAGATELAAPIADAAINAAGKEAEEAAETFWKKEDGRRAAMEQFRAALAQLTAPETEDKPDTAKPLIVVIDELDRCRPDYALALLEVIKHFFSVPRVHFVLGVNLEALQHSVRARYGASVNAADYLKRFISFSIRLPTRIEGGVDNHYNTVEYFEKCAASMGIIRETADTISAHLKLATVPSAISLRDVEKLLTNLILLPEVSHKPKRNGWLHIIASLLLLKTVRPNLYDQAIKRVIALDDLEKFYGIRNEHITQPMSGYNPSYDPEANWIHCIWQFVISNGSQPEAERDRVARAFDNFADVDIDRIFRTIISHYFESFVVPSSTK